MGLSLKYSKYTYITSHPFSVGVGSDHFLPLATHLTHTFRFFYVHQIPHTDSPVSGTLNLAFWSRNVHLGLPLTALSCQSIL
jgi:hypothetical protein